MSGMDRIRWWLMGLVFLCLSGCSSLVDRWSPESGELTSPETFVHAGTTEETTRRAGSWWRVFDDPELNRLIRQMHRHNPDLEAALARLDQSFSVFDQTRAGLWPTLRGQGVARNRQDSVNELLFPLDRPDYERFQLTASLSWEIDLWGRVRGMVKRDRLLAESEAETFMDAVLSLEGQLARQYYAWRSLGLEIAILDEAVRVRDERLALERSRLELGTGVQMDVGRSQVELNTARAESEATNRSRGKLAHAMAVLVGTAPSSFDKPPKRTAKTIRRAGWFRCTAPRTRRTWPVRRSAVVVTRR
ncbi:MAG: TolC family protein [Verrucomicrobiota bacterium]